MVVPKNSKGRFHTDQAKGYRGYEGIWCTAGCALTGVWSWKQGHGTVAKAGTIRIRKFAIALTQPLPGIDLFAKKILVAGEKRLVNTQGSKCIFCLEPHSFLECTEPTNIATEIATDKFKLKRIFFEARRVAPPLGLTTVLETQEGDTTQTADTGDRTSPTPAPRFSRGSNRRPAPITPAAPLAEDVGTANSKKKEKHKANKRRRHEKEEERHSSKKLQRGNKGNVA